MQLSVVVLGGLSNSIDACAWRTLSRRNCELKESSLERARIGPGLRVLLCPAHAGPSDVE